MRLTPYGNMSATFRDAAPDYVLHEPYRPIPVYQGSAETYRTELDAWRDEVSAHLWPRHAGGFDWTGGAEAHAEAATQAEVTLCRDVFQYGGILDRVPQIRGGYPVAEHRDHMWHYLVEDLRFSKRPDAAFEYQGARTVGANFLGYYTHTDGADFADAFWYRNKSREPSVLAIKEWFQRPRPYVVARGFGMDDFAWYSAEVLSHTGIHPAFPSGHCFQGLVHSANILQNRMRQGKATGDWAPDGPARAALKQYAVDWGDRRVFAGVHYPTDNIASWLLLLRFVDRMFDDGAAMRTFVTEAIRDHSHVYQLIDHEFAKHEALQPARALLDKHIPFPTA